MPPGKQIQENNFSCNGESLVPNDDMFDLLGYILHMFTSWNSWYLWEFHLRFKGAVTCKLLAEVFWQSVN